MVLYSELPVYRDTYKLLLEVYQVTNNLAREYKYSLGQDLKTDALALLRDLYKANRHVDKQPYLEAFLNDFELLRLELRLCVDLKLMPIRKMAQMSQIMDSIGRQVTAWRHKTKFAQSRNLSA